MKCGPGARPTLRGVIKTTEPSFLLGPRLNFGATTQNVKQPWGGVNFKFTPGYQPRHAYTEAASWLPSGRKYCVPLMGAETFFSTESAAREVDRMKTPPLPVQHKDLDASRGRHSHQLRGSFPYPHVPHPAENQRARNRCRHLRHRRPRPALWFGAVRCSRYDALLVHIAVLVGTLAFLFLALSTGSGTVLARWPASPRRSSSLRSPGLPSESWRTASPRDRANRLVLAYIKIVAKFSLPAKQSLRNPRNW